MTTTVIENVEAGVLLVFILFGAGVMIAALAALIVALMPPAHDPYEIPTEESEV